MRLLRGAPGSKVSVTVLRGNMADPHVFELVREAPKGDLVKTIDVTPDYLPGLATHAKTNVIAAGAFDGSVHLYDAKSLEPIRTFVARP